MKQDGRLGVRGCLKLGLRPVHHQPAERHPEPVLGLAEKFGRTRIPFQQVTRHSDELGALAWKQEGDGDRLRT